jgi:hypothetical protein
MKIFFCLSLLFTIDTQAAINLPWESFSEPSLMEEQLERNLSRLPLAGQVKSPRRLWANDYWPRNRGLINYRWNSPRPEGFDYESPTFSQLLSMTKEEIAELSPAEKLDILNGNYDYPLKKEVSGNASKFASIWQGICHGWAPASINHDEPTPKILLNPHGLEVPFGSSDIKALLSYFYANHFPLRSTHQLGKRCQLNFGRNCEQDLNAGAFHLILTNRLGLRGESFVADVERKRQVWNHAISSFQSKIVHSSLKSVEDSAPGTVRRVYVKSTIIFVKSIKRNSWFPVLGTDLQVYDQKDYEYTLDLNGNGEIIGGEWTSEDRSDFLWLVKEVPTFRGRFARLSDLIND